MFYRTVVFMSFLVILQAQESTISFLPDVPRCIGEEVQMICYISSESLVFISSVALISLNGSAPFLLDSFNAITSLGDVDLTRYTADTTGLTISTSRPGVRVTISNYQATDGSVLFGCGGFLTGAVASDILVEGQPQRLANPPSPPVSLTADYNSSNCSGTVQLAWTPGASDRDIEMYFLSLNGVLIASFTIASLGFTTSYVYMANLQKAENTYSIQAMSCAGTSTLTAATPISFSNPPVSPVVSLSQLSSTCSNIRISWTILNSQRHTFLVYRDDILIADTRDDMTTDNTQLSISTVYEYSVVAISCAGNSIAVVKSVSIGGTSLAANSLSISYDDTTLSLDWTLNTHTRPIDVTYSLGLVYNYTQDSNTTRYNETYTFSQKSTDTNYTQSLTEPIFLSNDSVLLIITATLSITQQCNTPFSDGIELTATLDTAFIPTPALPSCDIHCKAGAVCATSYVILVVVVAGTSAIVYCILKKKSKDPNIWIFVGVGCLLIGIGVIILVVYCVLKKKDSKKNSDSQELQDQTYSQVDKDYKKPKVQPKPQPPAKEKQTRGNYADLDLEFPLSDNLKKPEPVPETLYTAVQSSSYRSNH